MTHKIPNAQINDEISQKNFQISRPVHVIFKTDKLDYLGSPKTKLFFESFFFIGQGTSSTGKWNWNLLGFSSLISTLGQCAWYPAYEVLGQHLCTGVYIREAKILYCPDIYCAVYIYALLCYLCMHVCTFSCCIYVHLQCV